MVALPRSIFGRALSPPSLVFATFDRFPENGASFVPPKKKNQTANTINLKMLKEVYSIARQQRFRRNRTCRKRNEIVGPVWQDRNF